MTLDGEMAREWNVVWTTTGLQAEECGRMRILSSRFCFPPPVYGDKRPYPSSVEQAIKAIRETVVIVELDGHEILRNELRNLPCHPYATSWGASDTHDPLAGKIIGAGQKFRVRREGGDFDVQVVLSIEPLQEREPS